MEKDKFSKLIDDICGEEFGEKVEKKLTEFYPALANKPGWRDRFAEHLEHEKSFKTVSAMLKIGRFMDDVLNESLRKKHSEELNAFKSQHGLTLRELRKFPSLAEYKRPYIDEFKQKGCLREKGLVHDPQVFLDRNIETIYSYADAYVEQMTGMNELLAQYAEQVSSGIMKEHEIFEKIPPLMNNIPMDSPYQIADSLLNNEYNPGKSQEATTKTLDKQLDELTRCNRAQLLDMIKYSKNDSLIARLSMALMGTMVPQYREIERKKTPEFKEYLSLAEKYPRYVFAACADIIDNQQTLTSPQMLKDRMNKENVALSGLTLTKEECDKKFTELVRSSNNIRKTSKIVQEANGRD